MKVSKPMNLQNVLLILSGSASLLVTLLHIILAIRPQAWQYFGAGELTEIHEKGSPFTLLVTLGLILMFSAWVVYAYAGAGIIRPLPWMRTVLIAIEIIYILRSLMLPAEIFKVIGGGYPFRFILLSVGFLTPGLLYLLGTITR